MTNYERYTFSGSGEDFGPKLGGGLVILHTTESVATKNDLAAAKIVAAWQDRSDTLGSYNRLIAEDGILLCVPDDRISGGTNPTPPPNGYFQPVSWLYDMLPDAMVNNPNAYAQQLSAVGAKFHFDTYGWPDGIIDNYARSIIDEETRIGRGVVVANHAHFQPGNRSDAGDIAMDLVMKRYAELVDEQKSVFLDVKAGSTFADDIEWARQKGLMTGVGDNKFSPKEMLTREQMAGLLHRFYNLLEREETA